MKRWVENPKLEHHWKPSKLWNCSLGWSPDDLERKNFLKLFFQSPIARWLTRSNFFESCWQTAREQVVLEKIQNEWKLISQITTQPGWLQLVLLVCSWRSASPIHQLVLLIKLLPKTLSVRWARGWREHLSEPPLLFKARVFDCKLLV